MATTISLPLDIQYARLLKTYFSWNTEDESIYYWNSFARKMGFTPENPPVDSDELKSQFEAFLQKYKQLGISPKALQMGEPFPTDSYVSYLFSNYFPTLSESEKNDIWNQFLVAQERTMEPAFTADVRSALEAFVKIWSTDSIAEALNSYFGEKSEAFRILLWKQFAASKGVSSLIPSDTIETQADFLRFIQRYSAFGIDIESISTQSEIPTSTSFYQNYIQGFFGNLSAVEQQDIWKKFLQLYGYSASFIDTEIAQKQFAQYINSTLARMSIFENATNLSPREMSSRLIVNNILGSLKKFLNATQTLISVQSSTLMSYGKMQQAYTEMMTRVPNLMGEAQPKVKANATSPENFTFGYNDTSLKDVIRWGVHSVLKNSQPAIFGNRSPGTTPNGYTYLTGEYSFELIHAADGSSSIKIGIAENSSSTNTSTTIQIPDPSNPNVDELITQVSQGFTTLFQNNPQFISAVQGQGGIPGRYLGLEDTTSDDEDEQKDLVNENAKQIQLRAEVNANLQQYVENIRSRREVIQTFAKQLQTTLNQLKEGLDLQTSLWTSILESIDSIMQEINKK
ncbi:MAG: hypothetical protein QRY74_03205 [Chlamydia sp.]